MSNILLGDIVRRPLIMFVQGTTNSTSSVNGSTFTTGTSLPSPPSGVGWNYMAIKYGSDLIIGLGSLFGTASSTSLYSTDQGNTWNTTAMPSSHQWNNGIWGNGTYVCISADASVNIAAYTTDGITWNTSTLPTAASNWTSLAWNGTVFYAVAGNTVAATSTNGTSWTTQTAPASGLQVYSCGKNFVAFQNGGNDTWTSTDGVSWTHHVSSLPANGFNGSLYSGAVSDGNNAMIAVIDNSGNATAHSTDGGITWSGAASLALSAPIMNYSTQLAAWYAGDGGASTSSYYVLKSPAGTWSTITGLPTTNTFRDIICT